MEEQLLQLMLDRAKAREPGAEESDGGAASEEDEGNEPAPVFKLREHLQQAPGFQPFLRYPEIASGPGSGRGGRRDEGGPGPGSTAAAAAAAAAATSSESD